MPTRRFLPILLILVFLAVPLGLVAMRSSSNAVADDAPQPAKPNATILWISIDGVRPDYVERGRTPVLDRLMREGAYSRELVPVFPSLTFPSHVSQATGVKVREHGIPGNSFIDVERERTYRYPPWANMMQAEPIWLTAARQGVRVAVYDWPVSHAQRGPVTTEYFGQRYEGRLTDRERITVLMEAWRDDPNRKEGEDPLRLLMGYMVGPDSAGHEFGPDAREPVARLEEVDRLLDDVLITALQFWHRDTGTPQPRARRTRRDAAPAAQDSASDNELWVILTTDHGMSNVHSLVHIGHLAGLQGVDDIETVTSGNTGHLFFTKDREIEKNDPARLRAIIDRINSHDFAKAWHRSDLPREWDFAHPTRTGDIVVVLDNGHTFSTRPDGVTGDAARHGGPLGMHGYDPRTNPEMNGLMVVWRHPEPLGGVDLGRVHSLQLHATVAELLGIKPAEKARKEKVDALLKLRSEPQGEPPRPRGG